jgi:hypothetical protein
MLFRQANHGHGAFRKRELPGRKPVAAGGLRRDRDMLFLVGAPTNIECVGQDCHKLKKTDQ